MTNSTHVFSCFSTNLWHVPLYSLFTNMQINSAQARVVRLVESTLQLSNVDLVASYVFRGEKSAQMPAIISVQNDILGQSVLEGQVSALFSALID